MNWSSEAVVRTSYVPMEYCDANDCLPSGRRAESVEPPPATVEAAPQPDPEVILAERLENERRTILAESRTEIDREVQRARNAIAESIAQFAGQRDAYFRQVESEVVQLALSIARRIVHRESQVDPKLLAGLVRYEMEQLDSATSVRLLVPTDAFAYWNEAASAMPRKVEVCADRTITPGTLRMETALGSTAINFEGELKEIERGFFDLLSHRPATEESRPARVQ